LHWRRGAALRPVCILVTPSTFWGMGNDPTATAIATRVTLPGGSDVAFSDYGDPAGLPVLALHGAPASRLMFAFADASAKRLGLRIIAPDRPGCGLTPLQDRPHSLVSVTNDMAALSDHLLLDRFGLLGISGGGPYAASLAARLGSRISVLAIVSPVGPIADLADHVPMAAGHRWFFLFLPRQRCLLRTGAHLAAAGFRAMPDLAASVFARMIGDPDRTTLAHPEARATVIAMTRDALRQGIEGPTADLAVYGKPWEFDPAEITARALIWQGTADVVVPPAAAFHLATQIAGSRLFRIEGGGHFWVLDHLDAVLETLSTAMRN
jgi:pimeloyl-ACP methyl ester carboxylesterase